MTILILIARLWKHSATQQFVLEYANQVGLCLCTILKQSMDFCIILRRAICWFASSQQELL